LMTKAVAPHKLFLFCIELMLETCTGQSVVDSKLTVASTDERIPCNKEDDRSRPRPSRHQGRAATCQPPEPAYSPFYSSERAWQRSSYQLLQHPVLSRPPPSRFPSFLSFFCRPQFKQTLARKKEGKKWQGCHRPRTKRDGAADEQVDGNPGGVSSRRGEKQGQKEGEGRPLHRCKAQSHRRAP